MSPATSNTNKQCWRGALASDGHSYSCIKDDPGSTFATSSCTAVRNNATLFILLHGSCSRRRLRFGDKPRVRPHPGRVFSPPPAAAPSPHLQQHQQQQAAGIASIAASLLQRWHQVSSRLQDNWGRLLYNYFNWRQDNTSKDLLLIFTLFFSFVMLGSCTHRWVIDDPAERGMGGLWNDVYQASALAG
jgi:hypothetical protein